MSLFRATSRLAHLVSSRPFVASRVAPPAIQRRSHVTVHSSTESALPNPTQKKKKKKKKKVKLSPEEEQMTQDALDGDVESQHRLGMFYLAKAKGEEPRFPELAAAHTKEEQQLTEQEIGKQKAEAVISEIRAQQRANNKVRRDFVRQSRRGLAKTTDTTMTALITADGQKINTLKQQGVQWLLQSHQAGHVESTIALANVMYDNVIDTNTEEEPQGNLDQVDKIISLWKSTAPHPDSCFNLGKLYHDGIEELPAFKIDRVESMKWFNMASEKGDVASKYWLGFVHHQGDTESGVVRNGALALQLLKEASELDHADASMYLYSLYRNGDLGGMHGSGGGEGDVHIEIDLTLAWKYLLLAKDQGSSDALNVLADVHFHGEDGVDVDQTIALRYYLEAGDAGHSNALCSAAAMFFHGLGTDRNFTKAYQLYQHAVDADGDNKEAWRNLASCYYHGHGTKIDVKLAKTILNTVLKDEV